MGETIAFHYVLTQAGPPMAIGGLTAYAVTDTRDPSRALCAMQTRPGLAPRHRLLSGRVAAMLPHAMMPLDSGTGRDPSGEEAFFIICPAPPGPAIAGSASPWPEQEIIRCLLLPAAAALDALHERGATHRAIRPDNLFRAGPGEKVTLGPFWAAPPASLQPAVFEPPYAARCLPSGRGEGSPTDDVYALGVTMLWCLLGAPAHWADEAEMLAQKYAQGSLAALTGPARLSGPMQDLLRGMLAEDPDHRPPAALLLDPEQARSRRLAVRPAARAPKPFVVQGVECWSARELARGIASHPQEGGAAVTSGAASLWLRRIAGESSAAARLDEAHARAMHDGQADRAHGLAVRACVALDPLSPLVWRGVSIAPDGVASALAEAQAGQDTALSELLLDLLGQDAITAWAQARPPCAATQRLAQDVRDWRAWLAMRGMAGGVPRLIYGANTLLPCLSPLIAGRMVVRLPELLPALEVGAAAADRRRPPLDPHLCAFIGARGDPVIAAEAGRLHGLSSEKDRLAVFGLFGRLQQRYHPAPLPGLAQWLLESGLADLDVWRGRATRQLMEERLQGLAAAGQITPMALLLQDRSARQEDEAGAAAASARLDQIRSQLAALREGSDKRAESARQSGRDAATGISLLSLLGGAAAIAFAG